MIMKEITPPGFDFKITASDISLKSLMVGQQGFYADSKVDGIPEAYLAKYFTKAEYNIKISGTRIVHKVMVVKPYSILQLLFNLISAFYLCKIFCKIIRRNAVYFIVAIKTLLTNHKRFK